jgi:hypothetical protein
MRGATVTKKCKYCGDAMTVRAADVARGWGKFCSKSCKAKKQEARTGQYAAYNRRRDGDDSFQMSQADLACGGYGDADNDTPFGDGKF